MVSRPAVHVEGRGHGKWMRAITVEVAHHQSRSPEPGVAVRGRAFQVREAGPCDARAEPEKHQGSVSRGSDATGTGVGGAANALSGFQPSTKLVKVRRRARGHIQVSRAPVVGDQQLGFACPAQLALPRANQMRPARRCTASRCRFSRPGCVAARRSWVSRRSQGRDPRIEQTSSCSGRAQSPEGARADTPKRFRHPTLAYRGVRSLPRGLAPV